MTSEKTTKGMKRRMADLVRTETLHRWGIKGLQELTGQKKGKKCSDMYVMIVKELRKDFQLSDIALASGKSRQAVYGIITKRKSNV